MANFQFKEFEKVRMQAVKLVYPLQKMVDFPFRSYDNLRVYFRSYLSITQDNSQLQTENLLLKAKLQKLISVEMENFRLKELLNSTTDIKDNLLVSSVLSIDPDPFVHQIILDKGEREGVYLGQPIIDSKGIVGTVVSVNSNTSNALLITDANFAIPIENTRNNVRAIAIGTGTRKEIELQHIPNTADFQEGDVLVTSGFGGKYPFGYIVGEVLSVKRDSAKPFAKIKVKPISDLDSNREILLVVSQKTSQRN